MNGDEIRKLMEQYNKMPMDELNAATDSLGKQVYGDKTHKWDGKVTTMKAWAILLLMVIPIDYFSRKSEQNDFMDKINKGESVTMIEGMPMHASYPDYFKDRIADGEDIKPTCPGRFGLPRIAVTYTPESVAQNGGPAKYAGAWFWGEKIAFSGSLLTLLLLNAQERSFKKTKAYAKHQDLVDKYEMARFVQRSRQKERE